MSLSAEQKRAHAQALIDMLNVRDFAGIAAAPWFDGEGAVFHSAVATSEGEVYLGVEGLRAWARAVDGTWEDFRIEMAGHHDVDADRSLAVFDVRGRAKMSGVPLVLQIAQVWTWRDGVLVRNDSFTDVREAFEHAGLPYEPSTRSR